MQKARAADLKKIHSKAHHCNYKNIHQSHLSFFSPSNSESKERLTCNSFAST